MTASAYSLAEEVAGEVAALILVILVVVALAFVLETRRRRIPLSPLAVALHRLNAELDREAHRGA